MIPHPILPAAQRVARLALWLTLAACLGRLGGYAWARVQAMLAARVEDWFESVKADLSRLAAEVAAGDWQPDPPATPRQRPAEPRPRPGPLPETLGRKPATPPPRAGRQNRPPDAPEAIAPARPKPQPPPPRPDRPPLPTRRRERRPGAPAPRAIPRPSESQKSGKSAPTSAARPNCSVFKTIYRAPGYAACSSIASTRFG